MASLKIITDCAIPFLKGVLEPWAEVQYLPGAAISAATVRDADALIIRTRTRCDEEMLSGSAVQLIATATIGFDHIDTLWCAEHNIQVATAAGCNARGVLQWVGAALAHLSHKQGWQPAQKTLGIVGVGHVGSLVAAYAKAWGFRVICCDPPREAREKLGFSSLEELIHEADILTLHTPLDASTHHLVNTSLLASMRPQGVIINSSRGEVVDGRALLASGHPCILDVWEHEPTLDHALLRHALLATPHIAGYSEQGKANASALAVAALAAHFALPLKGWYPPEAAASSPCPIDWQALCTTIPEVFDIEAQSRQLKTHPDSFESMRDNYHYRREYF